MKILITGGTGFIGRYTVPMLSASGHELLVLSREPAEHAHTSERTVFIKGDLSEPSAWQESIRAFKPEVTLHLAWEGIPDYSAKTSAKNLVEGLRFFEFLAETGCKKLVSSGSCWEYEPVAAQLDESASLNFHSAFPAAKNALHFLGSHLAKERGMQFVWARLFYVYGPGQREISLIPHLIEQHRLNKKPELKTPDACNDFVHVRDVAEALALLVEKHIGQPDAVYNVGSGYLTGIKDIVRFIYDGPFKMARLKTGGFYADIENIRRDVGWQPKTDIEAGIAEMI